MKLWIVLALLIGTAQADDLDQLQDAAVAANPTLEARQAKVREVQARAGVAGTWMDPMVSVEVPNAPISTLSLNDHPMSGVQLRLQQTLQPPRWSALKRTGGDELAQAAIFELADAEVQLRAAVARAYWELDAMVQFPGVTNAWTMPIKTRIDMLATGIKTPVGIKLLGDDLNELSAVGQQIEAVLHDLDGTASVYSERVTGGNFIDIRVRRADAARYGLNVKQVQAVTMGAIGGMNVTETVEGLERYPVNLRFPRELRDDLEALRQVAVPTPTGHTVPLGQVADIVVTKRPLRSRARTPSAQRGSSSPSPRPTSAATWPVPRSVSTKVCGCHPACP